MKRIIKIIIILAIIVVGVRYVAPTYLSNLLNIFSPSSQEAFIEARGIPGVYMILFSDAEISAEGKPVLRDEPLRMETWTYGTPYNAIDKFENGFFTGGEVSGSNIELMSHDISPLWFTKRTSPGKVERLLGAPDCEESFEAGPDVVRTIKYEETATRPMVTVSFSDKQIIAASVGIGFSEGSSLCSK